jgi:AcrR family transcriptional regulator
MPAKPRFTREDIIEAAVSLVRKKGLLALSARNLAAEMGSSPQPIFSEFTNMDEVHTEVWRATVKIYFGYILNKGAVSDAFRRIDYIRFAKEEPNLFAMLHMRPKEKVYSITDVFAGMFTNTEELITSVQSDYNLSHEAAFTLCTSMWFFIHGIACLCATGMSEFNEVEMTTLVNVQFERILNSLKSTE